MTHQFLIELKYESPKIIKTIKTLTLSNLQQVFISGLKNIIIREVIRMYMNVSFSTEKKRMERLFIIIYRQLSLQKKINFRIMLL